MSTTKDRKMADKVEPIVDQESSDVEVGDSKSLNKDDQLLQEIGYKPDFNREFTRLSTLSYAISIMGVLGSVSATWASPLAAGGPATAIWCWFAGTFFALCIGLSIAELVSAYPTAGGMYFVTKHVFPKKYVPVASWIIGWCNLLGQSAGVASVGYSVGQMILAAVTINSASGDDGPNAEFSYTPTAGQTVGVAVAVLVLCGGVCSLPTKRLGQVIKWFAPVNLIGSVAITIALLVLTKDKQPASYVFGKVVDNSGWNSSGFSFLLGFLSVAWTMTDYDATTHISEEQQEAAIRGPVAITQAVIISGVFGWMLNVAYGFCSGDMTATLGSSTGNAAAQIFFNAAGRKGSLALWVWPILVQIMTCVTAMLSVTRTFYALARDRALPFSDYLAHNNGYTRTPLYSVWVTVIFCICMNLIAIGSVQTINGIFGITAPALDLSYIAVIAARLWYEKELPIRKGPFVLGRWQKPINIIAIVWTCFISVILIFPPVHPVTAANMNYAVVWMAAVALFALVWWYLGARKYYVGPRADGK